MGNTDTFCFSSDPFSSTPLGQMKHEVQVFLWKLSVVLYVIFNQWSNSMKHNPSHVSY